MRSTSVASDFETLDFGRSFKRHVKNWYTHSSSLFEQYGVRYVGPIDGHDLGALERVQAIFGAHVDWRYEVGEFVAQAGPLAASTDTFEVDFRGSGGHGARPQDTKDPVVGMASFVGGVPSPVAVKVTGLPPRPAEVAVTV